MAFTQSCFIRKNTPKLRKKLEEFGYKYGGSDTKSWGPNALYCFDEKYYEVYPAKPSRYHWIEDCGTNEELFLALAALRDNSDYMQWFLNGKGDWYLYLDNKFNEEVADWTSCASAENWHKATAKEIIEHFKDR